MKSKITRESLISLLVKRNEREARFVLLFMERTKNKVWDSSVGKYGAWVEKK